MERMARPVRQTRMMDPPLLRGLLGTGLLCAALGGCGSVVASAPSSVPSSAGAAASAATTTAPAPGPQIGCASVNQATAVSIRRLMRLLAPVGTNPISSPTYHQAAQLRALFGQLCAAVTHPAATGVVMHCPADFGTEYVGTFYAGSRVLATFTYASSGCARVSVTAAGKTLATTVYGRAAAAAPHLAADLDVILGAGAQQPGGTPSPGTVNPGGPNVPA
jgi:hypothetical protein